MSSGQAYRLDLFLFFPSVVSYLRHYGSFVDKAARQVVQVHVSWTNR
jgi:hypothetical protein